MSLLQSSVVRMALAAGAATCVWAVAAGVNRNLGQLPIQQIQQVNESAPTATPPALYPVWAGRKVAQVAVIDPADVEGAFNEPAPVVDEAEAPPLPNYAELLRPSVKIDGTTDTGAFINGRYFRVGRAMDGLSIQDAAGVALVPRLTQATASRVVIAIGGDTLTLQQGASGWE